MLRGLDVELDPEARRDRRLERGAAVLDAAGPVEAAMGEGNGAEPRKISLS